MIRHLTDIQPTSTSHGVGEKRVLLSSNESGCSLTQIAVTELMAGEVATAHVHPDMQEGFYVLEGQLEVTLGSSLESVESKKSTSLSPSSPSLSPSSPSSSTIGPDTFVYVDHCTSHELKALTDVKVMTIGCVIEASRNKFYPMLFKQNRKTLVWGTEDWTVSGVPNSESEVENGTWARYNLTEVISRYPQEILGKQVAAKYNNQLPLLAKIIDAHQDLSIQVHPNDEMALREHNKFGKSEMWYILDAEPGAYLYAGFKEQITPEQFKEILNPSSLTSCRSITDVLARHDVKRGDVFYLPAGRVHAICGGIRLAEVQQSSDVTYRIYDYNRPGLDGKPRELHTELAAQAIDFTVYPEYKTEHAGAEEGRGISSVDKILDTPYFSIKVVETIEPKHRDMIKYDSFIILMNLGPDCKIKIRSTQDEITLPADTSCLIPAAIADYDIIPLNHHSSTIGHRSSTKLLEAFINNRKTFGTIISDFFRF